MPTLTPPSRIDPAPQIDPALVPPPICGTATLTAAAMRGENPAHHADALGDRPEAALLFDAALLATLALAPDRAHALQREALAQSRLYRIHSPSRPALRLPALRLLALCQPGDLMANTPLDFLTHPAALGLDLLFLSPGTPLPNPIPEHDIAFFAAAEPTDPAERQRLEWLYFAWPRPCLNNPALLPALRREALCRHLAGIAGLVVSRAIRITRAELARIACGADPAHWLAGASYPLLLRPDGSHAGHGLTLLHGPTELGAALAASESGDFHLSHYLDYRSPDGLFRKYRLVLINGQPHLAHLAISSHWMVHYLNAGMDQHPARRAEEAAAFARFESGFARRHSGALHALHQRLPLDYLVLDCAETPDGQLLLFEADTAAIIHAMDATGPFAYKQAPMQRIFTSFAALARSRATRFETVADLLPA